MSEDSDGFELERAGKTAVFFFAGAIGS